MRSPVARLLLACGLAAGLVVWGHGRAWAQTRPPKGQTAAAGEEKTDQSGDGEEKVEGPKVQVERGAGGKKVYRITTGIVIEGRIQKPNAFYVLQRSQINYDWAALKKNFTPRILRAVSKHPF